MRIFRDLDDLEAVQICFPHFDDLFFGHFQIPWFSFGCEETSVFIDITVPDSETDNTTDIKAACDVIHAFLDGYNIGKNLSTAVI